ncbi:MAG: GNAT family N-acetyltransferase [Nitrospirota bacterium]
MDSLWVIRSYRKEDKEGIFGLYKDVWTQEAAELSKRRWDWEFEENPNNPAEGPFIRILEYKGELVGFIAGIFTRFLFKGKVYQAPWLVDLMTHPKYRGRGFLLMKKAYEENPLNIGFSNEVAYQLWTKMAGYDVHLAFFPLMKRPLNLKNFVAKFIKNKLLIKWCSLPLNILFDLIFGAKKSPLITITQISSFPSRIDEFWNQISKNFNAISIRDSKYLNWRFVACPDVQYAIFLAEKEKEIVGYIVLRICKDTGYIVDFLAEKEGFKNLIRQAIRYFKQQNVNSLCCLEPKDAFYHNILKRNGFFTRKTTIQRFIARSTLPDVDMEFLKNPENWFITLGDSDMDMVI